MHQTRRDGLTDGQTVRLLYASQSSFGGIRIIAQLLFVLFVCFVALRPKSTAMVMAGRSVHLTTLFPGQA